MKGASFILVLVCLFSFSSCHKYPEDPKISFKKPATLLGGVWKVTGYTINGTDHIHDLDTALAPFTLADCWIEFDINKSWDHGVYHFYNGNGNEMPFNNSHNGDGCYFSINSGGISLSSNCTFYFELWKAPSSSPYSPSQIQSTLWTIRKLTKTDLHIRYKNNDIFFSRRN